MVWKIATDGGHKLARRDVRETALKALPQDVSELAGGALAVAQQAIFDTVRHACDASLAEAVLIQARHSAGFMTSKACLKGTVGSMCTKTMNV
jgi:hypothetical protein